MPRFIAISASLALSLAAVAATPAARAGETFNTCAGFIDSLPATITTQGVWCLRKDLSTAIIEGNAVTIATNNVTIDCNDFKIGGLAAGRDSYASGIFARNQQNVTVRNCNIRGFSDGIRVNEGGGHLIEDNLLDGNLFIGISASGHSTVVQRNRVLNTGGGQSNLAMAISSEGHVLDNVISGLWVQEANAWAAMTGIFAGGKGARISGNTITGFNGVAANGVHIKDIYGIDAPVPNVHISDNHVVGPDSQPSEHHVGIWGDAIGLDVTKNLCTGNTVARFVIAITSECIKSNNHIFGR